MLEFHYQGHEVLKNWPMTFEPLDSQNDITTTQLNNIDMCNELTILKLII
jgi:hypothetical protein